MAEAGTAFVKIAPDMSTFQSQVAAQLAPITSRFGKLGGAAAVGLGAIAVGAGVAAKALYDVGETFDNAYDRIRIGTGATGRELQGLQRDFRDVFGRVPADAETVSTAITKLNQRLGLTGPNLRRMAHLMVELSRITETDLSTNIENVTRVFGDFGIKVQQQPAYLNRLFRASQATGVSVDKLSDTMVQFGSPLRSLGFNFDQAAAMVGKFEKEGVNTRLVMGSLRIALGRMADQGVNNAGKAFEMLTNQIKNAKSPTEATRKAIELFGARAGPDMARAIIEGRFEFDRLVGRIKNGKDSIDNAARSTKDLSESFQQIKNNLALLVEPIATPFFNKVGEAAVQASEAMRTFREDIRPLTPAIGATAKVLGLLYKLTWPVYQVFRILIGVLPVVAKHFVTTRNTVRAAGIGISNAAKSIGNAASTAFKSIKQRFQDAIGFLRSLPGRFAAAGRAIGNAIKAGVRAGLSGLGGILSSMARGAIDVLKNVVNAQIRSINSVIAVADAIVPRSLPRIPQLARGTSNFQGGMALVGERGPELVNLPRGSQVFTAAQTRGMVSGLGPSAAPEVRVFIGDRELTDIVRVEMREKDRNARASYRTGVRP